jgi:uncharacterized protein YndB with AHSA1/START domain
VKLTKDTVSIQIDASAERVFDLVSDIEQMIRFSPELVSCRWLDGAIGPAVGARFEVVNKLPAYRQTWKNRPVVVEYDPPRQFATSRTEPLAGTLVWRYELAGDGQKTQLTESYEVTRPITALGWFFINRVFSGGERRADMRRGMEETLQAIKITAEADPGRGSSDTDSAIDETARGHPTDSRGAPR